MPPKKQVVEAKVVAVDPSMDPVEAEIVSDRRNTLGRRLGIFAIAIILLFFSISGYIQSATNGGLLHRAAKDRSELVESVAHLSHTNDEQTRLIKRLQNALRTQNLILQKNGFQTVRIPRAKDKANQPNSSSPQPAPGKSPSPSSSHHPTPKPSATHGPNPPPPNDVDKAAKRVCKLTGICLIPHFSLSIF